MEAVNIKNCATSVQLPAATSWELLIARLTNASTTAATKDATATVYSMARFLFIEAYSGLYVTSVICDVFSLVRL